MEILNKFNLLPYWYIKLSNCNVTFLSVNLCWALCRHWAFIELHTYILWRIVVAVQHTKYIAPTSGGIKGGSKSREQGGALPSPSPNFFPNLALPQMRALMGGCIPALSLTVKDCTFSTFYVPLMNPATLLCR